MIFNVFLEKIIGHCFRVAVIVSIAGGFSVIGGCSYLAYRKVSVEIKIKEMIVEHGPGYAERVLGILEKL